MSNKFANALKKEAPAPEAAPISEGASPHERLSPKRRETRRRIFSAGSLEAATPNSTR